MTAAPWIQVESSLASEKSKEAGLGLTLLVPPHEIPQAVRGNYDNQLNRFVIELRYPDDEDFKCTTVDDMVRLRVGKKSNRLLGIELDTTRLKVETVQFQIQELKAELQKVLNKLQQEETSIDEQQNYSFARKAIESKQQILLSPNMLASAH